MEAFVDNEEAEEVSNHKIEEDPNQENFQTAEIVQKAEIDQNQGTKT